MSTEVVVKAEPAHQTLVPTRAQMEAGTIIDTGTKAPDRLSYPYVGFYGAKTRETDALDAAGIETYEFYLHDQYPIRLRPFEMHVLSLGRFYTKADNNGQPVRARSDCPEEAYKDGFREHLYYVAAVRVPGPRGVQFVPAVGAMRSGLAKAFSKPLALLNPKDGAASTAERWSARGQAEADGAHAKMAGGRFILTAWCKPRETESGDANDGFGSVRPTPRDQVDAFNAWYESSFPKIAAVAGVNNLRIEECRKLLGK